MRSTEPKVKRALPLLNANGERLAFGGSFQDPPMYETWTGYEAAMARRETMDKSFEDAIMNDLMHNMHSSRHATEQQMSDGDCPLDGIPIKQHKRCYLCHILIGPKHYAHIAVERDGKTYCADCASRKEKR